MYFDTTMYLVSDSSRYIESEFLYRIESALDGGVTLLQLREKERSTREYIDLAKKVKKIADRFDVPLIVDDRVDVALAADVAGVHIGRDDMDISTARRILGDDKIIGATAKSVERAVSAHLDGADYLGVGAIFPTTTKVKTVLTSVETLRDICQAVSIPVNAIGGLNSGNIDVLAGCPIAGICVVSAIMHAEDPSLATRELLEKINSLGLCRAPKEKNI